MPGPTITTAAPRCRAKTARNSVRCIVSVLNHDVARDQDSRGCPLAGYSDQDLANNEWDLLGAMQHMVGDAQCIQDRLGDQTRSSMVVVALAQHGVVAGDDQRGRALDLAAG